MFGGFKTYRGAGGALLHFPGLRNTSDRAFSFCLIPLHPNRTHFMQEYLLLDPSIASAQHAARGGLGTSHVATALAPRPLPLRCETYGPHTAQARHSSPRHPLPPFVPVHSPLPPQINRMIHASWCATAVACGIARRVAPVPALPLTLRAAPPATAAHLAAAWHRSSRGASSCAATRTHGCAVLAGGRLAARLHARRAAASSGLARARARQPPAGGCGSSSLLWAKGRMAGGAGWAGRGFERGAARGRLSPPRGRQRPR